MGCHPSNKIKRERERERERRLLLEIFNPRLHPLMLDRSVTSRNGTTHETVTSTGLSTTFLRMNQSVPHAQMSTAPHDVPNEDGESFHVEASEAPMKIGINAAAPTPSARITAADGLHLHLNPRAKSGYTRVESLPDGRFRVAVDKAAQIACMRNYIDAPCVNDARYFCLRRGSTPSTPRCH